MEKDGAGSNKVVLLFWALPTGVLLPNKVVGAPTKWDEPITYLYKAADSVATLISIY